jgi:hypothetical protein
METFIIQWLALINPIIFHSAIVELLNMLKHLEFDDIPFLCLINQGHIEKYANEDTKKCFLKFKNVKYLQGTVQELTPDKLMSTVSILAISSGYVLECVSIAMWTQDIMGHVFVIYTCADMSKINQGCTMR